MSSSTSHDRQSSHTPVALIAAAWALVGVPLAYGLYNTVKAATALFGG
jgi:hypothetical protein